MPFSAQKLKKRLPNHKNVSVSELDNKNDFSRPKKRVRSSRNVYNLPVVEKNVFCGPMDVKSALRRGEPVREQPARHWLWIEQKASVSMAARSWELSGCGAGRFNGAVASQPRNAPRGCSASPATASSFNGAVASQPRNGSATSSSPRLPCCFNGAHRYDNNNRPAGYRRPKHLEGLTAVHLVLRFADSVTVPGPLTIGAGRHCGLGSMANLKASEDRSKL